MRHSNQVQVLLVSKYSLKGLRHEQLASWLQTTAQSLLGHQQERVKKVYLLTLNETRMINMS